MAFLDLRDPMAGAIALPVASAPADAGVTGFETREWRVIGLARKDGLASLRAPGRLARLAALLFGDHGNPRLADARLETLRRTAVQAWHRGFALPVSAMKAFREAGFSIDQLELLLASVSVARTAGGRGRA